MHRVWKISSVSTRKIPGRAFDYSIIIGTMDCGSNVRSRYFGSLPTVLNRPSSGSTWPGFSPTKRPRAITTVRCTTMPISFKLASCGSRRSPGIRMCRKSCTTQHDSSRRQIRQKAQTWRNVSRPLTPRGTEKLLTSISTRSLQGYAALRNQVHR